MNVRKQLAELVHVSGGSGNSTRAKVGRLTGEKVHTVVQTGTEADGRLALLEYLNGAQLSAPAYSLQGV